MQTKFNINILLITILLFFGLLLSPGCADAQSGLSKVDTDLMDFAKRYDLIKSDFLRNSKMLGGLDKAFHRATEHLPKLDDARGQIVQRNNFVEGDTLMSFSFFSDTHIKLNVQPGKFPLSIGVNVRNVDGQFSTDLSTASLSFNKEAYNNLLNQQFWKERDIWRTTLDQNLFAFSPTEQALIQREYSYTFYQQLITSSIYEELKEKYAISNPLDTALLTDEQMNIRDTLMLLEERYQVHKKRLFDTDYSKLLAAEKKAEEIAENYHFLPAYEGAFPGTEKTKILSKSQRLLQAVEKFELGFQHLIPTDYVCTFLPVNGLGFTLEKGALSSNFFIGRQAFSGYFLPSNGLSVFDNGIGNNLMMAQVAYANSYQRETKFTFLRVVDQNSNDSENFLRPERTNNIFGFTTSIPFEDKQGVNISAYSSFTKLKEQSASEAGLKVDADNLATEIAYYYQPRQGFELEAGYFRTGLNYLSFADPFQLRNRQGLAVNLKARILKNKLAGSYSFKLGLPATKNVGVGNLIQTRSIGKVSYFFGQGSQVLVAFIPNTLRVQGSEEEVSNRQSIFNADLILLNYIKKKRLLSHFRFSNYLAGQHLQDTATFVKQFLLEVGEIIQFNERSSIELRCLRAFGQELTRINAGAQFGISAHFKVRLNAFAADKPLDSLQELGIGSEFIINLGKKGSLSISGSRIYQKYQDSTGTKDRDVFYANSSLFWTL